MKQKHIPQIFRYLTERLRPLAHRAAGFFGGLLRPGATGPAALKGVLLAVLLLALVPAAMGSGPLAAFQAAVTAAPTAAALETATATTALTVAATPTARPTPSPTVRTAPPAMTPTPAPTVSANPTTAAPTARPATPRPAPVKPAKPANKPAATPAPPKPTLLLRVYKGSQTVVALRAENGKEKAVRVMICSTGRSSGLTPNGTFKISSKYAYRQLQGAMGQYCSRFNGGILFHSVPIDNGAKKMSVGKSRMKINNYKKLGSMDSDGCVRLLVRDALWIYNNCPKGTRVEVVSGKSPFGTGSKPALKSGPPYTSADGKYGWDPTDPDPKNPYRNSPATAPPAPTASPSARPTATPTAQPTAPPTPSPTAAPTAPGTTEPEESP